MAKMLQSALLFDSPLEKADEDLVRQARDNPAAFTALYDRYLASVYSYLYTKVSRPQDAEDLTSQVFLAALEALDRFSGSSFRAWLFGIARRKTADFYRQRRPQVTLDQLPDLPAPSASLLVQVVQGENLRRLARLFGGLAENEQELLRLRFVAQLSFVEIARLLGKKESAVKMMYYRLLERLQQQMEDRRDE